MKVYLGGTVGKENDYRNIIIPQLKCKYFNPIVPCWTPDSFRMHDLEKRECDKLLFVITYEISDMYTIAEFVDASNKYGEKMMLCIIYDEFSLQQKNDLRVIENMCMNNGVMIFRGLDEVVWYLNNL